MNAKNKDLTPSLTNAKNKDLTPSPLGQF